MRPPERHDDATQEADPGVRVGRAGAGALGGPDVLRVERHAHGRERVAPLGVHQRPRPAPPAATVLVAPREGRAVAPAAGRDAVLGEQRVEPSDDRRSVRVRAHAGPLRDGVLVGLRVHQEQRAKAARVVERGLPDIPDAQRDRHRAERRAAERELQEPAVDAGRRSVGHVHAQDEAGDLAALHRCHLGERRQRIRDRAPCDARRLDAEHREPVAQDGCRRRIEGRLERARRRCAHAEGRVLVLADRRVEHDRADRLPRAGRRRHATREREGAEQRGAEPADHAATRRRRRRLS